MTPELTFEGISSYHFECHIACLNTGNFADCRCTLMAPAAQPVSSSRGHSEAASCWCLHPCRSRKYFIQRNVLSQRRPSQHGASLGALLQGCISSPVLRRRL